MGKLSFSGHEKFHCRQFWLKKGYDFLCDARNFSDDDAVVAFGVAYVVIVWFLRIISNHTFWPFVAYRLGFALVIVVLLLSGVVDAVDPAVVVARS